METNQQFIPVLENIPYPSHPLMRYLFKSPILFWRMGFGPLVGKVFMIMTTWGRKSGLPRRTAIEYHTYRGKKYVMAAWPNSDWYRNLQVNPVLTIQTASGSESVKARRLAKDDELTEVFSFAEENPTLRLFWQLLGFDLTLEDFLLQKDRFHMLTFDPSNIPGPPALEADLKWVALLMLLSFSLGWIVGRLNYGKWLESRQ